MDPTNLNQPVYTYTPSVKAGKVAAPNIQTYISAEKAGVSGVGSQFNAAVAAADEAARAGSTVQGKSITDYIAANRSVFDISSAANLADGKSVADYQNAAGLLFVDQQRRRGYSIAGRQLDQQELPGLSQPGRGQRGIVPGGRPGRSGGWQVAPGLFRRRPGRVDCSPEQV
jgi:hypothetical protein